MTAITVPPQPPPRTPGPEGGEVDSSSSALRVFLRTFAENKLAVAGVVLLLALIVFSWIAPLFYHTDQVHSRLTLSDGITKATNVSPGPGRPLGTDGGGFDILGRLMRSGQVTLEIGFVVGFASTVIGIVYGAISGYFGKWLDSVLMRLVDIGYSIPVVFLFIYVASVEKSQSETLLIFLLTGITWLVPARLVRGETLSLRTREYVQAMRTMGGGSFRAIRRHIVPNTIGTIAVTVTFQVADGIILLSILQYLGFGLPPSTPTWGGMLSDAIEGNSAIYNGFWWQVYPAGIMIILAVIAVNFIGDALRDAFEVRLQKR